MTRIVQSGLSGGIRKISGAHSCSWPMQKGQCCCWSELGLMGDLDLKSEGRLALAGENITHRFVTESFLSCGVRAAESDAIAFPLCQLDALFLNQAFPLMKMIFQYDEQTTR